MSDAERKEPAEGARASGTEGAKTAPGEKGSVILVAEGEPLVRGMVELILRAAGYRVLVAVDGAEAVQIVETHDGPLDLLVTDVRMPHMDGTEVARRIRELRPGVPVLLMCGYSVELTGTRPRPEWAQAFLEKPFTSGELLTRVRAALGRGNVP